MTASQTSEPHQDCVLDGKRQQMQHIVKNKPSFQFCRAIYAKAHEAEFEGNLRLSRIVKNEELNQSLTGSEVQVDEKSSLPKKPIAELTTNPVSSSQTHDFYTHYKQIHKIKQKQDHKELIKLKQQTRNVQSNKKVSWFEKKRDEKSPIIEYLKQVDKDKQLPLFNPFRKVADASATDDSMPENGIKVTLDTFHINCEIAPSICQFLTNVTRLQMLSLADTMLTDDAFLLFCKDIPQTLISLDLSRNYQLTVRSYSALHRFMHLKHVNVEQNNLGDDGLAALLEVKQDMAWKPIPLFLGTNINPKAIEMLLGGTSTEGMKKKDLMPHKIIPKIDQLKKLFHLKGLVVTLKYLNISRNKITDTGVKYLQNFLMCTRELVTLLAHWNLIRAPGAILIAKQLKLNKSLRVLDISFNCMGNGLMQKFTIKRPDPEKKEKDKFALTMTAMKTTQTSFTAAQFDSPKKIPKEKQQIFECSEVAWKWRKTLMRNMHLLHLDISHNSFKPEDMEVMGDGLKENHTLIGMHVTGNFAVLDHMGFIQVTYDDNPNHVLQTHQFTRLPILAPRFDATNQVATVKDKILRAQLLARSSDIDFERQIQPFNKNILNSFMGLIQQVTHNNCWVCEGYNEVVFEVEIPKEYIDMTVESVNIHFDFEEFQPMAMRLRERDVQKSQEGSRQLERRRSMLIEQRTTNLTTQQKALKKQQTAIIAPAKTSQVFYLWRMVPPTQHGIRFFCTLKNPKTQLYETFLSKDQSFIYNQDGYRRIGELNCDLPFQSINPSLGTTHETIVLPTLVEPINVAKLLEQEEQEDSLVKKREYMMQIFMSERQVAADLKQIQPPLVLNLTRPIQASLIHLADRDPSLLMAKPRQLFSNIVAIQVKEPWRFETSFFAQYKLDTDAVLHKLFEFDWQSGKLERLFKKEEDRSEAKAIMRENYKYVREAYKHMSAQSPAGIIPSIGMNAVSELMLKAKDFVDYSNLKLSDVDLSFIATNAATARVHQHDAEKCNNPERQLIRFQFLEILVRVGLERFHKKPPNMSQPKAIKTMFEDFMIPVLEKYHSLPWRKEKYWNEECDTVIKSYETVLRDIYQSFANALTPGGPKIMRLNNFIDLITMTGCTNDNFGAREIGTIFGISKQSTVDEIYTNGHLDMSFVEFVEALARVADKALETKKKLVFDDAISEGGTSTQDGRRTSGSPIRGQQNQLTVKKQPSSNGLVLPSLQNNMNQETKPLVEEKKEEPKKSLGQILRELKEAKLAKEAEEAAKNPNAKIEQPVAPVEGLFAKLSSAMTKKVLISQSNLVDEEATVVFGSVAEELADKIKRYIKKIASTCMGQAYGLKFLKEESKKQQQKDIDIFNANKEADQEMERLAAMGLRATLTKIRKPKVSESPSKNVVSPKKVAAKK